MGKMINLWCVSLADELNPNETAFHLHKGISPRLNTNHQTQLGKMSSHCASKDHTQDCVGGCLFYTSRVKINTQRSLLI